MQEAQLLEHVAAEHRDEVRRLYAAFIEARKGAGADGIENFANELLLRGLLSTDGLKDFILYRALSVGDAPDERGEQPGERYEIMAPLGRGAMGEVFLGRDPELRRTVALKFVRGDAAAEPVQVQRFLNEAQVTAQLDHPAIVPVYGLERTPDGKLAYAMKLVRGVTLAELLAEARRQFEERGRPAATHSLRARVELLVPVLNAIAYAHRRGVVHRDLKPENIMIGSFGQVLVLDWGIARVLGQDEPGAGPTPASAPPRSTGPKLTSADVILGTLDFMSPEQAAGREIGPPSDQYALGLILQEIATLRPAMKPDDDAIMLVRAMQGIRQSLADGAERVPRELGAIIAKATALEPSARYASVAALADDLTRFLRDESVEADPDRGVRRVVRWIGKHRQLAAALAAAGAVLAFALVMLFVWLGQAALIAEREAARRHELALSALEGLVEAQGKRMSEKLHRYEALLEGIASSASVMLRTPAPPSDVVVYQYRDGKRDPEAMPAYAVRSKAYGQPASLRPDYSASWGVDRQRSRERIDQLARIEPLLRTALLRSSSEEAGAMPFAAAEKLVLERGVPLVWTYLYTEDGLGLGMPGTWESYDSPGGIGYDHRREDWYRSTLGTRGPVWTVAADESQFGLTVSCLEAVRDETGAVLGVAGVDVWLDRFIEELLEIPTLAASGAEGLLLDAQGAVIIRSREKDKAKTLTDYVPEPYEVEAVRRAVVASAGSGRHELAAGRMALWTKLGSAGMSYLVVGAEAAMLAAAGGEAP